MPKAKTTDLSHHFLVAMPMLNDPNFKQAVIYVCEHNTEGAMGIIINKPLQINLGNVLRHLNIEVTNLAADTHSVFMGGPIGQEHGFIIHNEAEYLSESAKLEIQTSHEETPELVISSSKDTLQAIAHGKGPAQFIVALGYTGWEAGQLEQEISDNTWLVAPYGENLLFTAPIELRWQLAAASLGINIHQITTHIGHA
jgi:putative transcriptional regulator